MGHKDVGYKIRTSDKFAALLEIMNENSQVEIVYFTMIWDILDGHPLPYEPLTIWHDVRNCGTSEINPPDGKGKFEATTKLEIKTGSCCPYIIKSTQIGSNHVLIKLISR